MLQLELLTNNPKNIDVQKPSFLFIHGMWHGAWCWEPYFLPYFEKHELKAYALSLSNHSNSAKRKPFNLLRISDYVKDIKQVIDGINEKLIIVGHSMGGFVLQKYLEKNDATGAVLMASVPPFGIWNGTLFVLKNFTGAFLKANVTFNLKHIVNSRSKYKRILCSDNYADEKIEKYLEKTDTESYLAYIDMLGLNLVNVKKIKTPLLILGGGKDSAISKKSVIKTAEKYKTEAVIFEKIPHMMMLSPDFNQVADRIIKWAEIL